MPFQPNIPQSTDFLSDSQSDLLQNNLQLDTSFGIDHYTFSNLTADNGKHNYVTTPRAVNNPVTATGHPDVTATQLRFYAMQDTANIGLLQYSRGWDAAGATSGVPSAVTYLQSPNAAQTLNGVPTSTLNIFDFTGITNYCFCKVILHNLATAPADLSYEADLFWRGASNELTINQIINTFPTPQNEFLQAGNIFRMRKASGSVTYSNIYWSIQFYRIVV
jgi:hypothetical protein